jgi:hypothetical protein
MTHHLTATAFVLVGLVSSDAHAYRLQDPMTRVPAGLNYVYVDKDISSRINYNNNQNPGPIDSQEFFNLVDRAAQVWNRAARANVALAVIPDYEMDLDGGLPTVCPPQEICAICSPFCPQPPPPWCATCPACPGCGCLVCPVGCVHPPSPSGTNKNGTHDIVHRERRWCDTTSPAPAFVKCEPNPYAPANFECDTIFWENHTAWKTMHHPDNFNPPQTATRQSELQQTLAHEFGHLLGLADTYQDPPSPSCHDGDQGDQMELMCSMSSSWDFPAPDDIDGVRAVYSLQKRDVKALRGTVSAAGIISLSAESLNLGVQSIVQPRIGCRAGTDYPDCVVTRTSDDCDGGTNCVWAHAVSLMMDRETWNTGNVVSKRFPYSTPFEVDVAVAGNFQRTVMLVMLDNDGRLVRWIAWNTSNPTTFTTGIIPGSDQFMSPMEGRDAPRVAFHKPANSFVVAFVDRYRRIRVSVAHTSNPTVWSDAAVIAPETFHPNQRGARRAVGPIDLVCPAHEVGAIGASPCRLAFVDAFDNTHAADGYSNMTASERNRRFFSTACTFALPVTAGGDVDADCWSTDTKAVTITSIADYGTEVGENRYAQNAWLLTGGRQFPTSNLNTAMLFSAAGSPQFRNPLLSLNYFDVPAIPPAPQYSYWGGVSCDFVEFGRRFVCVQLKEAVRW